MEKVQHAPLPYDAKSAGKYMPHVGAAVTHRSGNHRLLEIELVQNLFGPQLPEHAFSLRIDDDRGLAHLNREQGGLDDVVLSEEKHGQA